MNRTKPIHIMALLVGLGTISLVLMPIDPSGPYPPSFVAGMRVIVGLMGIVSTIVGLVGILNLPVPKLLRKRKKNSRNNRPN